MLYRTFQAFLGHSFLAKKKLLVVALMLVTLTSSKNKPHELDFLRDFLSVPSQKYFETTPQKLDI
jgi:hypothetical protein